MTIVAVDGAKVNPKIANVISISAGQRYDVIITAMETASRNYRIESKMVDSMKSNTGTLKYTERAELISIPMVNLPPINFNDIMLSNGMGQELLGPVTRTVELQVHEIRTDAGPR